VRASVGASPKRGAGFAALAALLVFPIANAMAAEVVVFHADSLAGPMRALKSAFEAAHPGVTLALTPGVSKQLAERIVDGEACDVFAPSSPAVVDDDLLNKPVRNGGGAAATWYVVFSANEMVIVAAKGNPLGIRRASDLARADVRFIRVTGEKDLATNRTVEFLKRATAEEGGAELAPKIVERAIGDPAKATNVPGVVNAVREGKADAGIVYYSAAVAARNEVDIVRFPASVNLSEAIRNAATVPSTARNPTEASAFVAFLLSPEAQAILKDTGQPPVVPALRRGAVPAEVK
jgi:molybdate transport system substrate-binding protein